MKKSQEKSQNLCLETLQRRAHEKYKDVAGFGGICASCNSVFSWLSARFSGSELQQ
jgi:hypothetical protein